MSLATRLLARLAPSLMLPGEASASLQSLVYRDIYGSDAPEVVTREIAMRVAPIKRARAVIIGRLGDLPFELGTFDTNGEFVADEEQPAWLTQTESTATTAWYRFAYSLEDVLFTGWCLWAVERDSFGNVTAADRIARDAWRFETSSTPGETGVAIRLAAGQWAPVTDEGSVVLFAGPDEGLLATAHDTIIGWRHMDRAWVGRVRNPIPVMVLHERNENGVTTEEAKDAVSTWASARTMPNGAVGFLPANLDLEVHGDVSHELFSEGRNAARIDIANHVNLPVAYLDGSTATSSLTYVTQEGSRNQVIDDLEYWIAPFEAVLSRPDITGSATKVIRLNRSNLSSIPNDDHGPGRDKPNAASTAPTPEESEE